MSGEEYEVEAIHCAKVVVGQRRKKAWSYYVKWKNYGLQDNTWEPPDSFTDGSEHFILSFWERANTGGRDWENLSTFRLGEEFFPLGPPRKANKLRENTRATSLTGSKPSDGSENEVQSIIGDDDRHKRKRRPSEKCESASAKRRRGGKPELQEDLETPARSALRRKRSTVEESSFTTNRNASSTSSRRTRVVRGESTPDEPLTSGPSHSRKAEKLLSPSTGPMRKSGRVSSTKAGPGRNSSGIVTGNTSLLTSLGGALQTVKGKIPPGRRSGVAWQERAGGGEPKIIDAQNSSDFEDDVDAHGEPDPDHLQPLEVVTNGPLSENVAQETVRSEGTSEATAVTEQPIATEQVAVQPSEKPADNTSAAPEAALEHPFPAWRRSTIFGPLGLGREVTLTEKQEPVEKAQELTLEESTAHLFLSFDYSVYVPVRLKDIYPPGSPLESLGLQSVAGPPGKFYKNEHAPMVLQTFRMEDSTARLTLDTAADDSHQQHFARFCSRLHAGELFVELIGVKLLAMFSSENRLLGELLATPADLLGLSKTVLVAQVAIENHSAYADAVGFADNTQWSASG